MAADGSQYVPVLVRDNSSTATLVSAVVRVPFWHNVMMHARARLSVLTVLVA